VGASPFVFFATAIVVVLAVLLGGGTRQGLWSDGIVQLASLLLIGFLVWRDMPALPKPATIFLILIFLLPILQLVPLPASVWTLLPGREAIAATYRDVGLPLPALPISLDAGATWRAMLALLPAAAVLIATIGLDHKARRSLSVIFIALGMLSVLLGLAQLMQGPTSPLRFYPVTNVKESVGFFANRNHYAALIYGLIPLTAAWMVGLVFDRRPERVLGLVVCVLACGSFVIGLLMARSRAGLLLALVAAAGSLLMAVRHGRRLGARSAVLLGVAVLIGLFLIAQFATVDLVQRFDTSLISDFRLDMVKTTVSTAPVFQPFGSGFGTFEAVYRMFELPERLRVAYANHAHNDWIELWLEGGWFAIALAIAFLVWFFQAMTRVWRAGGSEERVLDRALAEGATIAIVLLLLHSGLDYPLRTTAILVLFGYCVGMLFPPPVSQKSFTEMRRTPPKSSPHRPRTR
jgi:O-antigen ligase